MIFFTMIRMNHLRQERDERIEDSIIKDVKNLFRLKKLKIEKKQMTPQLKI